LQYGGKEGDRINDHHVSLAEKRAARKKTQETQNKQQDNILLQSNI